MLVLALGRVVILAVTVAVVLPLVGLGRGSFLPLLGSTLALTRLCALCACGSFDILIVRLVGFRNLNTTFARNLVGAVTIGWSEGKTNGKA